MTKEFRVAHQAFKLSLDDLEKITINSMKSAFIPYNRRIRLIYDVIKPWYQKARLRLKAKRYGCTSTSSGMPRRNRSAAPCAPTGSAR